MQINMDDIRFFGEYLARSIMQSEAEKEIKSHSKISAKDITNTYEKYSWENILKTEHGISVVQAFISGCINEYHNQLREKLLEQSIDIGEIDLSTPGQYRPAITNAESADEE